MIFGTLQHHFTLNTHTHLFHVLQIRRTKWCQLAKVNDYDFALTNAQGEFSITCLSLLVWTTAEQNWLHQCIKRREDRGRSRSAWTAASIVLVCNLICRLHQGLTESHTSVKHQQMETSFLKCILHKNNGQIKQIFKWCSWSWFLITFGLIQEARKVQQSHILIICNNWVTSFCLLRGGITLC